MTSAPACVLLTGPKGAGKQTVGALVVDELRRRGVPIALLGPASVQDHLVEGPEALAWCCALLVENGVSVVIAVPVATREDRDRLRASVPGFAEVHLDAPAEVCATRSGAPDAAFEEPWGPDLRVPTHGRDPSASAAQVVSFLEDRGVTARTPLHPSAR